MPRVAAFEEAAGDAQHHRRGEAVVGAPAHGPAIVDLLGRRLGIFAELDFGHRHQAGERHADRAADDPFLVERGVEHALSRHIFLEAERDCVDAALGPDVLAEHQDARIGFQFLVEHAADRGDHVDPLTLGRGLIGRAGGG